MLNMTAFYLAGAFTVAIWRFLDNKLQEEEKEDAYTYISELGCYDYKSILETESFKEYIVKQKVPIEDVEKKLKLVEKQLGVKAFVEDIPFTQDIKIVFIKQPVNLDFEGLKLPPTKLLIGYNYKGEPIIVDMLVTAHMGVVGNSLNGKTKCIETALKNNSGADKVFLNVMKKDFKGIPGQRINDTAKILNYLENILSKGEREKPLYIIIDEYNVLSKVKGIDRAIQDLLSQARHYNIYLIVIMQVGNKEDCKFKNLFNCRLAFRCVDDAMLRAFLGVTVDAKLRQQEFWLFHTDLVRGRTYNIDIKNNC